MLKITHMPFDFHQNKPKLNISKRAFGSSPSYCTSMDISRIIPAAKKLNKNTLVQLSPN